MLLNNVLGIGLPHLMSKFIRSVHAKQAPAIEADQRLDPGLSCLLLPFVLARMHLRIHNGYKDPVGEGSRSLGMFPENRNQRIPRCQRDKDSGCPASAEISRCLDRGEARSDDRPSSYVPARAKSVKDGVWENYASPAPVRESEVRFIR